MSASRYVQSSTNPEGQNGLGTRQRCEMRRSLRWSASKQSVLIVSAARERRNGNKSHLSGETYPFGRQRHRLFTKDHLRGNLQEFRSTSCHLILRGETSHESAANSSVETTKIESHSHHAQDQPQPHLSSPSSRISGNQDLVSYAE